MQDIALRFVGWHCFGETDHDGFFTESDEIYFIFGVVPPLVDHKAAAMTGIYSGVDAGESSRVAFEPMELYRGAPLGAALSITLIENDEGDPKKYHEQVRLAVEKTGEAVAEGLSHVPVVGTFLSLLAHVVLVLAAPAIVDEVNELLGTADDAIATVPLAVTAKDMMRLTRVGRQDFHGLQAHLESPLISGEGASYKAYFDIEVV